MYERVDKSIRYKSGVVTNPIYGNNQKEKLGNNRKEYRDEKLTNRTLFLGGNIASKKMMFKHSKVTQLLPLLSKGYNGEELDTNDTSAIVRTLTDSLALQDDAHIQQVMAELRVKDPRAWVKVDGLMKTMRELSGPREKIREFPVIGHGSSHKAYREIERNIHRFWAGGAMKSGTIDNILAMQEKCSDSKNKSSTPWRQYLWTSSIANKKTRYGFNIKNELDLQLEELKKAGVNIIDIDKEWANVRVPYLEDAEKSRLDLSRKVREDVKEKGVSWTKEAKSDLDNKSYDKIKWFSDLVRLIAINIYGGVYMDTDIGPGTLNLKDNRLYHTDSAGEIPHHAPPFRHPKDYESVLKDGKLGATPRERIIRYTDESVPALNYFLASRKDTKHLDRELATIFDRKDLTSGMAMFGRMFIPLDKSIQDKPTPYAPPEERVTPWVADLQWATEVSMGEG